MLSKQRGFSLIELMLALVISAILMGIAYPSYAYHEVSADRSRAEMALLQLAGRLENYFGENGSYAGVSADKLNVGVLVAGLPYQLSIKAVSDTAYEIQAIPQGEQAARDAQCGTLSLMSNSARRISGSGDIEACWR